LFCLQESTRAEVTGKKSPKRSLIELFETVAAQRTKRDLQLRYSVAVAQQRLPGFLEGKTTPNGRLAAGRLEHVVKLICLGWCTAVGHVDAIAKRA